MKKTDPYVHIKRAVWMQRVVDLVRTGHHWYIDGVCPLERLPELHDKLDRIYDHSMTRMQASRHRKTGASTARFLSVIRPGGKEVDWILLRTNGNLPPLAQDIRERWKDPRKDRISYGDYEIFQMTKVGAKKPVWTWKFQRNFVMAAREFLIYTIKTNNIHAIDIFLRPILRAPGFAGIRQDVKKIRELVVSEWRKTGKSKDQMPEMPPIVGYIRKLADKTEKASVLLKKMRANEAQSNSKKEECDF